MLLCRRCGSWQALLHNQPGPLFAGLSWDVLPPQPRCRAFFGSAPPCLLLSLVPAPRATHQPFTSCAAMCRALTTSCPHLSLCSFYFNLSCQLLAVQTPSLERSMRTEPHLRPSQTLHLFTPYLLPSRLGGTATYLFPRASPPLLSPQIPFPSFITNQPMNSHPGPSFLKPPHAPPRRPASTPLHVGRTHALRTS